MIDGLVQLRIVAETNERLSEDLRRLTADVEAVLCPTEMFPGASSQAPRLLLPQREEEQRNAIEYPDRRRSVQVPELTGAVTHPQVAPRRQSVIVRTDGLALAQEDEDIRLSMGNFTGRDFPFEGDPWNGIFAHLTREANGNLAELGIIKITGNSVDKARELDLPKVVSFGAGKCWISRQDDESYIQFDFLKTQVIITHYSILTYSSPKGFSHLKSWKLIGRLPQEDWLELDIQEANNDLNGKRLSHTYECAFPAAVQLIRLVQTGPSHYGDKCLIVGNIEFFGHIM
jgi:hypothetical protein